MGRIRRCLGAVAIAAAVAGIGGAATPSGPAGAATTDITVNLPLTIYRNGGGAYTGVTGWPWNYTITDAAGLVVNGRASGPTLHFTGLNGPVRIQLSMAGGIYFAPIDPQTRTQCDLPDDSPVTADTAALWVDLSGVDGTVSVDCTVGAKVVYPFLEVTVSKEVVSEGADPTTASPGHAVLDLTDSAADGVAPVILGSTVLPNGAGLVVDGTLSFAVFQDPSVAPTLTERDSATDGLTPVGWRCGGTQTSGASVTLGFSAFTTSCTVTNQIDTSSFTVTKLLDGVPAAWPVTATLGGPGLGATVFTANGGTALTQDTDASSGSATFALDHVSSSDSVISLTLTEPRRSDGTLSGILCFDPTGKYVTGIDAGTEGWIDEIDRVGGILSLPVAALDGIDCRLLNDDPARLTLSKLLDGASSASFPLAAIPQTPGLSVGSGTTFDVDGLFPTAGGASTDVNVVFGPQLVRSESTGTVLVGEAIGAGYMFTGVACESDQSEQVPELAGLVSDRPLYLVDGVIGGFLEMWPWEDWGCSVENAIPALSATKTASVANPEPGGSFSYTITATNSGRTPLLAATLTDPLPAGVSATGATASSGTCTVVAAQVDCALGDMAIGASRTVTVSVSVASSGITDGQVLTNTATVTGQVPAWDPSLDVQVPEALQEALSATLTTHPITATATATVAAAVPAPTTTGAPTTTAAPTTVAPTTTVAVVAQQGPTTTAAPIPVVSPATLPRTGGGLDIVPVAAWSVVAGVALVVVRRVRRSRPV